MDMGPSTDVEPLSDVLSEEELKRMSRQIRELVPHTEVDQDDIK